MVPDMGGAWVDTCDLDAAAAPAAAAAAPTAIPAANVPGRPTRRRGAGRGITMARTTRPIPRPTRRLWTRSARCSSLCALRSWRTAPMTLPRANARCALRSCRSARRWSLACAGRHVHRCGQFDAFLEIWSGFARGWGSKATQHTSLRLPSPNPSGITLSVSEKRLCRI